jgi:hypothetical protein
MCAVYRYSLLVLTLLAGCNDPRENHSITNGTSRVGDAASVAYVAYNGKVFAAWTDISFDELPINTSGATSKGMGYSWIHTPDLRRSVKLEVRTEDGNSFQMTVNGTNYRTEDGTLFLVRTKNGISEVKQVKQDLSGVPPTSETWNRLAKENAEVKAFMDSVERKK